MGEDACYQSSPFYTPLLYLLLFGCTVANSNNERTPVNWYRVLSNVAKKRKTTYLRHVIQTSKYELLQSVLQQIKDIKGTCKNKNNMSWL